MMPQLPTEILVHIATQSVGTFSLMLALPPVARFLRQYRKYILDKFTRIEISDLCTKYYIGKKLHREDGPAIEYANGAKTWCRAGYLHRDDGPAIEWVNGTKWWYQGGKIHREDGPAIIWGNGDKEWYRGINAIVKMVPQLNGLMVLKNGTERDKLHRNLQDGPKRSRHYTTASFRSLPAIIWPDGRKTWYRNGVLIADNVDVRTMILGGEKRTVV